MQGGDQTTRTKEEHPYDESCKTTPIGSDSTGGRPTPRGGALAIRILLWSETFWPHIGGAEVLAARLVLALQERHRQVIVVTAQSALDLPINARYRGVPVYRFPFWAAAADPNVDHVMEVRRRVATLKRAFAPDLVHMHIVGPSAFFHFVTPDAHPAPLLVTLHEADPQQTYRSDTVLGQALRRADWVTACSASLLAEIRQRVPEITDRSSVIYNSLDTPAVLPKPLPSSAPILLCLGRLAEEKGLDLALAAFALLRDRFPHARLVIAGDGPVRGELEQQAAELGLNEAVHFAGWIAPDEVPALINTATLVVMPSRREAFGLVALQAALMARPVVAARVGGLPEIVAHGETGWLVEKEDSSALAETIADLLAHYDTAVQMGRSARRRAQGLFGWERCVDAYEALYQKLTQEAAHADAEESVAPK